MARHKRNLILGLVAVIAITVSCASQVPVSPFQESGLSWPHPPAVKRIEYLGGFSTASDLGIEGSVWERVFAFAVGERNRSMIRPMSVVATYDASVIFVADPDAGCVHRFDLKRIRYRCVMPQDSDARFYPVGVALTKDGRVFASDPQSATLYMTDAGGEFLRVFAPSVELDQPTGVFWDDELRHLYVTDTGQKSVFVLDELGVIQRVIGSHGSMPGQLNFPTFVWVDNDGSALVSDSLNYRVQRFGVEGAEAGGFGSIGDMPGDFSRPKGIATDTHGHVYVVDALLHMVQIFSPAGELLLSIGQQGHGTGEFWLPNGIFITKSNMIFVADSYNKRVQVFKYVGPAP